MLLPHFPPDLGFFNLKIHFSLTDSFNDLFHGTFWEKNQGQE